MRACSTTVSMSEELDGLTVLVVGNPLASHWRLGYYYYLESTTTIEAATFLLFASQLWNFWKLRVWIEQLLATPQSLVERLH
jgi:hypothetical protein